MIALILGTSEGRNILSLLNEFTDNILVSTATAYGGDILKTYKYKALNTKPLDLSGLKQMLIKQGVSVLVDASHPYALDITKNCREACADLKIKYLRYERPSISEKYLNTDKFIPVTNYEELVYKIIRIEELNSKGTVILNTTGSRNIHKLVNTEMKSRIVHRVLPAEDIIKYCLDLGVTIDDIIAIKGPIGYELNLGFINQYNAKAIILKDSGKQGGTQEKIQAALDKDIYIFVIEREKQKFEHIFYSEEQLARYVKENNLY